MITEDYVNFETAKLLKEKGFDELCHGYFRKDNPNNLVELAQAANWNDEPFFTSRPTLQMAMKWLRKVHKIHIVIYPYGDYSCDNYQFDVYKDNNLVVSKDDGYITYEQACEFAIKYCLENLI